MKFSEYFKRMNQGNRHKITSTSLMLCDDVRVYKALSQKLTKTDRRWIIVEFQWSWEWLVMNASHWLRSWFRVVLIRGRPE
ncbi:putative histidine kinase 1 [Fusarium oxysporum f. sp. albedinis]|nr:putative histidine kinase 1 [Fusarium oxysporum f. sp. albedinis]